MFIWDPGLRAVSRPRRCWEGTLPGGRSMFLSRASAPPRWLQRDTRRRGAPGERGRGGRQGTRCPSLRARLPPPPASGGQGAGCWCRGGSRGRPGSHGPGMCRLLRFHHNNSRTNSRAAAGGGGRDMCERGGGARGPARAKGRRSLSTAPPHGPPHPAPGRPRHRKFLVLPRCSKTCFWEVAFHGDGVRGLCRKRGRLLALSSLRPLSWVGWGAEQQAGAAQLYRFLPPWKPVSKRIQQGLRGEEQNSLRRGPQQPLRTY